MTEQEIQSLAGAMVKVMLEQFVRRADFDKSMLALHDTYRYMSYSGVWREGDLYERGNFVTHAGSLWHCNQDGPDDKPGTDSTQWTLAVKRGKDGKHADVACIEGMFDPPLKSLHDRITELEKAVAEDNTK